MRELTAPILAALVLVGQSRRLATPLTVRERRALATIGALLVTGVGAIGAWIATHDSAPASRNGCINVVVAGSLGGQPLHVCGGDARSLCARERERPDAIAGTVLPACRQAGIELTLRRLRHAT